MRRLSSMSLEEIHYYLVESFTEPEIVRKILKYSKTNVSYSFKPPPEGRVFIVGTPVMAVFATIFIQLINWSPGNSREIEEIYKMIKSAKLMVNHNTYQQDIRYNFYRPDYWLKSDNMTKTKNSEIYKNLIKSGFTLKSFVNNKKLTDAIIEDKANKDSIKSDRLNSMLVKVKKILNKKSFPVWLLLLIIISILFIIKKRIP